MRSYWYLVLCLAKCSSNLIAGFLLLSWWVLFSEVVKLVSFVSSVLSSHPLAIWTYYLFSSKLEKRAKVSRIIYFLLISSAGHAAPCKSLTKCEAAEWARIISDRKSLCKKEVINVSEDHTSVCVQTYSPLRTILNCYQFIVFSSFSFSASSRNLLIHSTVWKTCFPLLIAIQVLKYFDCFPYLS